MMTKDEFHNRLRLIRSIDSGELECPEWWPEFRANPYGFFVCCSDEEADVIWSAMVKRGAVKS